MRMHNFVDIIKNSKCCCCNLYMAGSSWTSGIYSWAHPIDRLARSLLCSQSDDGIYRERQRDALHTISGRPRDGWLMVPIYSFGFTNEVEYIRMTPSCGSERRMCGHYICGIIARLGWIGHTTRAVQTFKNIYKKRIVDFNEDTWKRSKMCGEFIKIVFEVFIWLTCGGAVKHKNYSLLILQTKI